MLSILDSISTTVCFKLISLIWSQSDSNHLNRVMESRPQLSEFANHKIKKYPNRLMTSSQSSDKKLRFTLFLISQICWLPHRSTLSITIDSSILTKKAYTFSTLTFLQNCLTSTRPDSNRPNLNWPDLAWTDLDWTWPSLDRPSLDWPDLAWHVLACNLVFWCQSHKDSCSLPSRPHAVWVKSIWLLGENYRESTWTD